MGIQFTEDQQKVITTRNKNILVSAAAGSGKTAVLVERILQLVTDQVHPIDIDRLLIVTFTSAAASEMRERISDALSRRMEDAPEDEHLQKQMTLIHNAQITTIDSFCLFVIRNNFNEIGLDPGFRVADEGELQLLRKDVLAELLEQRFAQKEEAFYHCVECYSTNGKEKNLEEHILQLYQFAMSYPFPEKWLLQCKKEYRVNSIEELQQSTWMQDMKTQVERMIQDCAEQIDAAIHICQEPDGPYMYGELLEREKEMLSRGTASYEFFQTLSFDRLPGKKDDSVSPEKRELAKEIRNRVKANLQKIKDHYFWISPEQCLADIQASAPAVEMLITLTLEFMELLAEQKREKNIIDFGDMEHFALEILLEEKEGEMVPTKTAVGYQEYFAEILTDEYQDSNLVQEYLLASISREQKGSYNRFMVGDVKQSIYKFRLARPEIFMEKYHHYPLLEGDPSSQCVRIDLKQNFRSRTEVIESVNTIFYQIMRESLGGVNYDKDAALYPGAVYPDTQLHENDTEVILIDTAEKEKTAVPGNSSTLNQSNLDKEKQEQSKSDQSKQNQTKLNPKETEAMVIAQRIRELVGHFQVTDKVSGALRPADYKDIVILLRTNAGWDDAFKKVLMEEGIPCFTASKTGYFSAIEIQTILNFIRILDNPLQDIPLCAVLRSVVFDFTEEDFARIRSGNRKGLFYDAMVTYAANHKISDHDETTEFAKTTGAAKTTEPAKMTEDAETTETAQTTEPDQMTGAAKTTESAGNAGNKKAEESSADDTLVKKIQNFMELLEKYRALVPFTPIHELLHLFMEDSGFYYYMSALPGGEQRKANLDQLLEKAIQFEKTSYHGLFHFIRYIEQMQKYDVDMGEANIQDENANVVRIMSIHKSKGLEFPICFVAGMSKRFNMQDTKKALVMDLDYGIGTDYINPEQRYRTATLRKNVIAMKLQQENIGEELRILYVALTRAREKLIMTGTVEDIPKKVTSMVSILNRKEQALSYSMLLGMNHYLDYILAALIRHRSFAPILEQCQVTDVSENKWHAEGPDMKIYIWDQKLLVQEKVRESIHKELLKQELLHFDPGDHGKNRQENTRESIQKVLQEKFTYEYPHKILERLYTKTTVSELKKMGYTEQLEREERQQYGKALYGAYEKYDAYETPHIMPETSHMSEPQDAHADGVTSDDMIPYIPAFMREKEEVSGTTRGSAYHRVLELLELENASDEPGIVSQMQQLIREGRLSQAYADAVRPEKIAQFLQSPLAARMKRAREKNLLYREQPFVLGVPANEIEEDFPADEMILVQGIIDVYFEEDGQLIVADYKTDRVETGAELWNRYGKQLDYYARALSQLLEKPVKEKIIYSFALGCEV